MHIRLLDKYVLKELLYPFVFGIASFSSIFIASSMLFKIVQYITTYNAPLWTVARLFAYSLPQVINYTFPMSMLLATLMAFGKLSSSSEIVAMKSGGVSYYRIVAPVLVVGFVVSMFSVIWAEKVVPPCNAEQRRTLTQEIRGNTKPRTQEHVVIKMLKGSTQRITYARSFDEKTGILDKVTIEEFQNNRLVRVQTADKATWEGDKWVMDKGTVYSLDDKEGITSKASFTQQVIPLNAKPREVSLEQKDADEMTLGELKGYIAVLERQHQPTSYYWTEIYMRFAIPLASFVFALLGAPLGTQRQRSGSSIGLGMSVIVILSTMASWPLRRALARAALFRPPWRPCPRT